ncbi:MAG: hypothetical protein HOP31_10860 [Ignavibacteria bacterium]|nr:hypothetical protein [Ignavibacteria bacterium]
MITFYILFFICMQFTLSQSTDINSSFEITDSQLKTLFNFIQEEIDSDFEYYSYNDEPEVYLLKNKLGILIKADLDVCTDGSPDNKQEKCTDNTQFCIDKHYQKATAYSINGRYLNADKINYMVLPQEKYLEWGVVLGDFGFIVNWNTKKLVFALFGETGPDSKIGEGSICAAKQLGFCPCISTSNGKNKLVGISKDVYYIVFGNSKSLLSSITSENVNEIITVVGLDLLKEKYGIQIEQ